MFRIWDNKGKKMHYDDVFLSAKGIVHNEYKKEGKWFATIWQEALSDWKIDWCTGRFDKKGTTIYSGDILRLERPNGDEIVILHWVKDRLAFETENISGFGGYSNVLENTFEKAEVIGNKEENPEIIEKCKNDMKKFIEEPDVDTDE